MRVERDDVASERDVCLAMLARVKRHGHLTLVADKGYAGRDFEHAATELDTSVCRPRRKDEPGKGRYRRGSSRRLEQRGVVE